MRRFELCMSLDYVSNWSPDKAINEVFQNALDEEVQNPENKWYFNYDEDSQTLKIGKITDLYFGINEVRMLILYGKVT